MGLCHTCRRCASALRKSARLRPDTRAVESLRTKPAKALKVITSVLDPEAARDELGRDAPGRGRRSCSRSSPMPSAPPDAEAACPRLTAYRSKSWSSLRRSRGLVAPPAAAAECPSCALRPPSARSSARQIVAQPERPMPPLGCSHDDVSGGDKSGFAWPPMRALGAHYKDIKKNCQLKIARTHTIALQKASAQTSWHAVLGFTTHLPEAQHSRALARRHLRLGMLQHGGTRAAGRQAAAWRRARRAAPQRRARQVIATGTAGPRRARRPAPPRAVHRRACGTAPPRRVPRCRAALLRALVQAASSIAAYPGRDVAADKPRGHAQRHAKCVNIGAGGRRGRRAILPTAACRRQPPRRVAAHHQQARR